MSEREIDLDERAPDTWRCSECDRPGEGRGGVRCSERDCGAMSCMACWGRCWACGKAFCFGHLHKVTPAFWACSGCAS